MEISTSQYLLTPNEERERVETFVAQELPILRFQLA